MECDHSKVKNHYTTSMDQKQGKVNQMKTVNFLIIKILNLTIDIVNNEKQVNSCYIPVQKQQGEYSTTRQL